MVLVVPTVWMEAGWFAKTDASTINEFIGLIRILVEDDRAVGVELEDGQRHAAGTVLPDGTRHERMNTHIYNHPSPPSSFTLHFLPSLANISSSSRNELGHWFGALFFLGWLALGVALRTEGGQTQKDWAYNVTM